MRTDLSEAWLPKLPNKEDRAKAPKLPSFVDEKDDMDAYLQRFERFATTVKWDKARWVTKLSALLSGQALFRRRTLRLLQDEDSSYEKVRSYRGWL